MATTKELKILITIANEAKEGLSNLLQNLSAMREQLDALTSGLSDIGKETDGLAAVGGAAEEATNKLENTTEAVHNHGESGGSGGEGGGGGHGGGGGNGHNGTNGENGHDGHNPDPGGHEEAEGHRRNTQNAHEHESAIHKLGEAFEKLLTVINFVSGGFLAIEALHLAKELLDVAARTETLGVVLKVVGQNAGYTVGELDKADRAVQKLGITAEASRESLAELIKAGIDLSLAPRLARASQDLAVVAGENSSETFKRLITNIDQMDTLGLRFMGVMIDKEAVMAKAANDAGRAISGTAQKQIFANAVLAESAKLAGVYEAAMGTAGKMLSSFPRYVEEFHDALGALGQGFYVQLIKGATDVVKSLTELAKAFKDTEGNAELFGEEVASASNQATGLAYAIRSIADAIVSVNHFLAEHHEAISNIIAILRDVAIAYGFAFSVSTVVKFIGVILPFLGTLIGTLVTAASTAGYAAISFGTMWAAALGPITLVVAGIAAVGLAVWGVVEAFKHWGDHSKEVLEENTHLTDKYLANLEKMKALLEKQDKIQKAQSIAETKATAGDPNERDAQRKDADKLKKENDEIQKELQKLRKENDEVEEEINTNSKKNKDGKLDGFNTARIEAAKKNLANLIKLREDAKRFETDLATSLGKVGSDIGKYSTGVGQKFNEVSGAIGDMLKGLNREETQLPKAISEISGALAKAAEAATNDDELKKYEELESRTLIDLQKRVSAEQFEQLRIASSNRIAIQRKVVEENNKVEEVGSAKGLAILRQRAKQESEFRVAALQRDVERRKALFDLDLSNQQFNLEQGLLSLKAYTAARNKEIDDALADEKRLSAERVASLKVKIDALPATDTEGRAKLLEDIKAEQEKGVQADIKAQRDRANIITETYNKQIRAEQSIAQIRNELNNRYGHEEVTIRAEVEQKLEDELKIIRNIGTEEDVLNAKERARLDILTRTSQLQIDRQKKELDNERAYIDLLDSRATSAQEDGQSTTLETQALVNENIARRMNLLEEERAAVLKVRDEYAKEGLTLEALEKNTQAIELTKQMYALRDSVKSVGKELENTFTNSLADNLDQLLSGTKRFRDAFLDIFKDLNKQIMKLMTKDFAETVVKSMKGDGQNGGIFSSLASLITGKPDTKPEVPKESTEQLWAKGMESIKNVIPPKLLSSAEESVRLLEEIRKNTEAMVKGRQADDQLPKTTEEKAQEKKDAINSSIVPFDVKTVNQLLGRKGVLEDKAGLANSPIFDQAAKAFNLDQYGLNGDFLKYIAAKESGFNPNAVSPAGAEGLMQLTPATAKGLGLAQVDIRDPLKNVMAGARLLAQLLDHYNGDLTKALAAYNAGPKVADARAKGDFTQQSAANKKQTDDYIAKLGPDSKLFAKPSPTDAPMPVVVVKGNRQDALDEQAKAATVERPGTAQASSPEAQQIQQVVITATREQVEAAKQETETSEKNATATTENTTKVEDSTVQLTTFAQSVATASQQLASMPAPKGSSPIDTGLGSGADGFFPVDTSAPATSDSPDTAVKSVDTSKLLNSLSGPISALLSAGVGAYVTKSMGHYRASDPNEDPTLARAKAESAQRSAQGYGAVASLLTNIASQKVLKSLFDPLKKNIADGMKDVGDGSKKDVDNMSGGVLDSMSSFFSDMGSSMKNWFSKFGSDTSNNMGDTFSQIGDSSSQDVSDMGGGIMDSLSTFFSSFGSTIMSFFSSSGSGSSGPGWMSSIGSWFSSLFSSGEGASAVGEGAMTVAEVLFAGGGYVSGPGTGTSDDIPARLSNGEYVMTAEKTAQYRPLLDAMRAGALDTTFSNMFSGFGVHIPDTPEYSSGGYVSETHLGSKVQNNHKPVSVNMTVVTPDANSFRRSQDQIASRTGQAVNRAVRRNT